jgi:hypothetical protein
MAQKSVDTRHLTKKKCQVALESHCIFMLKLESGKRLTYDEDDDDDDDDPTTTTTILLLLLLLLDYYYYYF